VSSAHFLFVEQSGIVLIQVLDYESHESFSHPTATVTDPVFAQVIFYGLLFISIDQETVAFIPYRVFLFLHNDLLMIRRY